MGTLAQFSSRYKQLAVRESEETNWVLFGKMVAEHMYDPYKLLETLWDRTRERADRIYGMTNVIELAGSTPEELQAAYRRLYAWHKKDMVRREYMQRYFARHPHADDLNVIARQCECGEAVVYTLYKGYLPKYRRSACTCGRWYALADQAEFGTGDLTYSITEVRPRFKKVNTALFQANHTWRPVKTVRRHPIQVPTLTAA